MSNNGVETVHKRECMDCHRADFDSGDWQFVGYDDEVELYICLDCQWDRDYVKDALLVRDAQLRIGADDAGQPCPSCGGKGERYITRYYPEECDVCKGTGHV